jgi:hypothetical protein
MDTARRPTVTCAQVEAANLRKVPDDGGKELRVKNASRNVHASLTPTAYREDRVIVARRMPPNVKHQRARATASRVKDELSLRALRCMR